MPINTWSKYAYATLEYLPYSIVIPPREYYIIACNKCVFSIRILSTSDTLLDERVLSRETRPRGNYFRWRNEDETTGWRPRLTIWWRDFTKGRNRSG